MQASVTSPSRETPAATARHDVAAPDCATCGGSGWADPWDLGEGTPQLMSCDRCLGVGLDGCPDCDGDGTFAPPVPCPCLAQDAA